MEWIKASERLPEINKEVAVKVDGVIGFGRFYSSNIENELRFSKYEQLKIEGCYFLEKHFSHIEWLDESTEQQPIKMIKEDLKELISLAEDGHLLHIKNASHQEFLNEDLDILDKAKKWLSESSPTPKQEDEWKWNDELVLEYAVRSHLPNRELTIEEFKKSKKL